VAWGLLALSLGSTAYFIWAADSVVAGSITGFLAVFAIILAPLVLQWSTGSCWRLLDNRPMHWVGERAYSFYVWHVLVFYAVSKLVPIYAHNPRKSMVVLALPAFPAIFIVTWLSYKYIESPFLRRRHLWRRGEQAQPGEPPAGAPVRGAPTPVPEGN
jgi:peptidoglycan/LPS O-acetylase OafA/YrhL